MLRKITPLDWTIIFFLSVSFCISNFHLLFNGVYSDAPMYAITRTSVSWFYFIVGFMINMVWLMGFAIALGLNKTRLNWKQASMVFVYGFSLYKDIYDWFTNGNQGTRYKDWIITVMLFAFVEILFWGVRRFRNGK